MPFGQVLNGIGQVWDMIISNWLLSIPVVIMVIYMLFGIIDKIKKLLK